MRCAYCIPLLALVQPLAGQGSVYLTLDDWATPVVEHLIRAGVLRDPSPLARPLTHGAVLASLAAADTTRLSATVRATLRLLRTRLDAGGDAPRYHLDLYLEPASATHDIRDPQRPAGDAWVGTRAGMLMRATMGPLAVHARPYIDTHLPDDPEWPGDTAIVDIPGRFTDVYLSLQSRYADVTLGAVARNWGLAELDGLLISGRPYTYDHLAVRLGSDRLRIESIVSQLDGFASPEGPVINRFLVAHRVTFRPTEALLFAIGTGNVYRGVGVGWDTRLLNPFKLPRVTAVDESIPDSANTAYLGDARVAFGRYVVTAQLLMDDWDVTPSVRSLPDRFAGTLAVEAGLSPTATARALYTGVSSLTYRTTQGPDFAFLRNGVGLGRNHSDYTQGTASVSLLPAAGVLVVPELTWIRQGESDLGLPFPPDAGPDYPFVFVGLVETTWRMGAAVRATVGPTLDAEGHAGLHLVRQAGHVAGATATEFVGGLAMRWRFFSGSWN